ncbi:hypothetical protein L3X38_027119 [Prunus dulcis]|uniref:Uncharacterized protein n=1 Tax=Prunus dulcis TaxID=3755 RepID=A0AAD4VMF3_PRUDU|nr:hypothetical protein L3X38_027119 [Prunus dulcis]
MDNNQVVNDAMSLSMQSATSVTSVGHRLIVQSYEIFSLKTWKSSWRPWINRGKHKQRDHDTSYAQAKGVIFGSSSDEPQEAVHENPREEVQRTKLKALIVESGSEP